MLKEITIGMTVECLHCKIPIALTRKTMRRDFYRGKYIICPECRVKINASQYHQYGKLVESEVEKCV